MIRVVLGVLLGLVALNAFAGGYYGMMGAEGVPVEWLAETPFTDYFVPSLFLFVVVGGSCLLAAIAVLTRRRFARPAAFAAVAILFAWLTVQVAIIGYVSWMQPTAAVVGVIALMLARLLPRPA